MTKNNTHKQDLIVGAVQCNSNEDVKNNLLAIKSLIDSVNIMPDVLVLPEMFNHRKSCSGAQHYSESLKGPTMVWLKELAQSKNIWIIAGSIAETSDQANKAYNTCVVLNPTGEIETTYQKIHLFDATLSDRQIFESNHFIAGQSPQTISINGWKFGLSICYDLRFPELYQHYAKQGVDAVVIPSSFTRQTGQLHWHVLCRARAIENQCYVIAPNQFGIGAGQKDTYGHSLICDPYGKIIAEADDASASIILATLDDQLITNFRSEMPISLHKKLNN